jgi:RNA polymerase sigma factor (sigma-70 family)
MVNDHGRTEDITQEVFMSALRRMRDTDRPIIFKPWVYEIAKNACIDAFRRARRAEEVSYDADEGLGSSDHGRLVSSSPTPDAAVDTRMSLDHLRGAFGGLSEQHHDILVMRELEGLSYREIGERLGMSRPSVESTLFRARRRLTEEYEELTSGERCRRVQALIAETGGRRMGIRDERKMARHVSYCQPCRRTAYAAGVDLAALAERTSLRAKVVALLPLPAFLKRRWFGGDAGSVPGGSGGGSSTLAHWSSTASQYAEPMSGWAKAAAVAASVAVAGVGAGVVTTHGGSSAAKDERPASVGVVPASAAGAAAAAKAAHAAQAASVATSGTRSHAAKRASSHRAGSASGKRPKAAAKHGGGGAGGGSGAGGTGGAGGGSGAGGAGGSGGAGGGSGAGGGGSSGGGGASSAGDSGGSGANRPVSNVTNNVNHVAPKAPVSAPKAPAPQVQAPTVSAPSTGNGTVDQVTGTATGVVNGAVGTATGAVNGAAGAATGAVDGAAGAASGAVNSAAGAASGAVSGAAGAASGAVSGAAGAVNGAVNQATGTASGVVTGATGAVDQAAGATTGAVTGATRTATGATGAVDQAAGATTGAVTGAVDQAAATTGAVTGATRAATGATADPVGTVTSAAPDPVGTATGTAGGLLPGG